jgi:diguanylate cyclase (GGDEF)-like protein
MVWQCEGSNPSKKLPLKVAGMTGVLGSEGFASAAPAVQQSAVTPPLIDPRAILSSIGEAVYDWDIATDKLSWSATALPLFGVDTLSHIATGHSFSKLIDPLSPSTRPETILLSDGKDDGRGVPYKLTFAVQNARNPLIWFEDTGRWFAGADGRAIAAHGAVRRIEGPSEQDRREIRSSKFDPLTGAFQRGPFLRIMADSLAKTGFDKSGPSKAASALLLIAVNDLNFVNQTYGFDAADEVIAAVAQRIRAAVRGKDRLVRYSGTKLGVFLHPFDGDEVKEAADRIAAFVSGDPIRTSAGTIAVGLHIGSVIAPKDSSDPIKLMRLAEEALTEARLETGPDYVAYKADVKKSEDRRRNLVASDDVVRALNERRVIIAFEPVLSAATRTVQFHEALVRVQGSDGTLLGAGAIIPAAERFGLVKYVDSRVLELAVDRLRKNPADRLSVNVSMRTAVTSEWMEALTAHIMRSPEVADRLIIEITETAAMADLDATVTIVRKIKNLGIRVAIDDFGSGHTSFRSMRALPIDILKIDGAFIQNLARSTDDRFFVRTLVDLTKNLGVQTVAEWVQDEETAGMLAEWGVTFLQGEFCGLATVIEDIVAPAAASQPLLRATG